MVTLLLLVKERQGKGDGEQNNKGRETRARRREHVLRVANVDTAEGSKAGRRRCYGAEKGGRDWLHQLQDPVGNENAGKAQVKAPTCKAFSSATSMYALKKFALVVISKEK